MRANTPPCMQGSQAALQEQVRTLEGRAARQRTAKAQLEVHLAAVLQEYSALRAHADAADAERAGLQRDLAAHTARHAALQERLRAKSDIVAQARCHRSLLVLLPPCRSVLRVYG
jgi:septal ring factor EnvC (AmiA/AmiB activator)